MAQEMTYLMVKMTPEEKKRVRRLSKRYRLTMSELVRQSLFYLETHMPTLEVEIRTVSVEPLAEEDFDE